MTGETTEGGRTTYDLWSRRSYLVATVGLAALSGCASAPEGESGGQTTAATTSTTGGGGEELPPGVSESEFEHGPVPELYATARSLGGETRDPGDLYAKADAGLAEYDEAGENDAHRPGSCCANCSEFVPDRNGDRFGACVKVEGYVGHKDWCTLWENLPEPDPPAGVDEDELATADVPAQYRTADSQAGETRTPDDLLAQADVGFRESREGIAEGAIPPGQSCGTCAEFVPDKDGDGWGACAKVEGYVAPRDWCSVWKHVSEEL